VLDAALDAISVVLAAVFVVGGGSDVATAGGCSGCETGGWEVCCGAVG
jgi:hypothetical protein